ncbi:MAG: hypothetical protein ACYS8Z_07030, partial [Planctomycetota bacterium]
SGFGIAATKANGDIENFNKLLRQAELLSLPAWSPGGEINYLFSKVLLADVLLLWGKTLRPWDDQPTTTTDSKPCMSFGFWAGFSILALLCLLILFSLLISLRRTYTGYKKRSLKLDGLNKAFLTFQALLFVLWVVWPGFTWIFAVIGIALAAIIENTLFPLKAEQ